MNRFLVIISAVSLAIVITILYVVLRPIDVAPSDFNFTAAGDWGCTDDTTDTVNNIIDKNPELVLGLGDYSYDEDPADCWLKKVKPINDKMKIAIGNHDMEKLNMYTNHFGLREQYYSFNYNNVHIVALSTEIAYKPFSSQYEFIENDLSRAASDPNIDWIVVYFHKQMYTSPSNHDDYPTLRSTYHPLFNEYGVDLVLQAHNHNYERTFPIKFNSNSPSNPIATTANTDTYTDPDGQIFATIGTGGVSLYAFTDKADHFVKQYEDFGILNIDITNEPQSSSLTGKFYANNGKIIDQFIIYK
ncbi:MAG TPA: metallophosphoesterase [Nitrososphaeraceae archaeon]|nr:metallophosphoesterase [Nitrososphaeraceae archaeon]